MNVAKCRKGLQLHFWDTDTGATVEPSTEAAGAVSLVKQCLHHYRKARGQENLRLLRVGAPSVPCFHCDRPVAVQLVPRGAAAVCPTCLTEREDRPRQLLRLREANARNPTRNRGKVRG